jgi:putative membrane protein
MMWDYYDQSTWVWMTLMMILFWGGLIAVAILLVRGFSSPRRGGDEAIETLRRRLAAGEITQEEFDKTRKVLLS